jgi:hypothetical protein
VEQGYLDYLEEQKRDKETQGVSPSEKVKNHHGLKAFPEISENHNSYPEVSDLDLPKGIAAITGLIAGTFLTRVIVGAAIGAAATTIGPELIVGAGVGLAIGLAVDFIRGNKNDGGSK